MPENTTPKIKIHAPNIPGIFGKFKDHKNPPKFRPIVNKKEGPTNDLQKCMADIYKKILSPSTCSLSSTAEFINHLRNINCKGKCLLVSFEVVNLYALQI